MRKRPKYYYIETFVYNEGILIRKNHYFFTRIRDFRSELFNIVNQAPSFTGYNSEFIRNAYILTRESSLYTRAHEELSKAIAEGYSSACVFFEYGNVDNAPIKL